MPLRQASDRRGRAVRGYSGLLEREAALAAIERAFDAVETETGQAILLEGHAGLGKTRLHEAALDSSRARGLRVARAAGNELERHAAFGVARQLLGSLLGELTASRREALLANAPPAARELAGVATRAEHEPAPGDLALAHSLFTVIAAADEGRPVMIAIDDLHWSDLASLELVLYLLQRLDEIPMAMVLSRRPGFGGEASRLLDRIDAHPRVQVVTLAPLGEDAVRELVRRELGSAPEPLVAACAEVTAGNPFYLHELLLALRDERERDGADLARCALALAPDAVTRTLRVRIGRLGATAGSLARAVAILGDDVPLRQAAALSGLSVGEAARTTDELASVEILLAREPLRFVHPLVRHAVELDVPSSERASRHLDAARLIYADGAAPEGVASHLLLGRAEGNGWVVEQLRAAASAARRRGAPQSAVSYLRRALEEPPAAADRVDVLAELGSAEAAAGIASGAEHLAAAAAAAPDPLRRAGLRLQQGHALLAQGQHEQAMQVYEKGLGGLDVDSDAAELDRIDLEGELRTGLLAAAAIAGGPALERTAELIPKLADQPRTHGERLLLARAAVHASFAGSPGHEAIELAARAWDDGRLLERDTADGIGWVLVTAALGFSGALEQALAVTDVVLEDARRRASPLAFASASRARAHPRLLQGAVADALVDLELARDARRYGWRQFTRAAAATHCLCLINVGELDAAEETLLDDAPLTHVGDLEDTRRMEVLAELRLAQGRPREAYEHALAAGSSLDSAIRVLGYCPWRITAAQAALRLGDRDGGVELAREANSIAESTGVLHDRIAALRVLGMCEGGKPGLRLLTEATELAGSAPQRLEGIRSLVELGSALRRANKRASAREPLQRAADMAQRSGAKALYERARTELTAAGARPRRELLLAGAASLTPSERRIAQLAADGHSNPDIARTLFVTPKTVEYHLRNAYRKLDITRRQQLANALRE
jgi:DNA-binding CsgD family transcriptional regulator